MICSVCKLQVPLDVRKEHLIKYHKLGTHLIDWIIQTDNHLIALEPKMRTHRGNLEIITLENGSKFKPSLST